MEKESLLEKDIVETATTESTRKDTSMAAWMDKKILHTKDTGAGTSFNS